MFKGKAMTYYGRWTYKYELPPKKAPRRPSSFMRPGRPAIPMKWFPAAGRARILTFKSRIRTWVASPSNHGLRLTSAKELFAATGQDFRRAEEGGRQ
jgi:hypothetical protein